jgi:hypothetical protein
MRWPCLLLLVPLVSCRRTPKVGDACEPGARACIDQVQGLYCAKGVYELDTCKGPNGCREEKGIVSCDLTRNASGDPCPAALDGFSVCREDRKTRALCKGGKYVVEKCLGEDGCTTEQVGHAECDRGPVSVGDDCTSDRRLLYCGEGGKSALRCEGGKFAMVQRCPGPKGCTSPTPGLVVCDPSGEFVAGDRCHFISAICTADARALLVCKEGVLVRARECPGPVGCEFGACDRGIATAGTVCPPGRRACSEDGRALLECKQPKNDPEGDYTWTVQKTCKTGCTPKDRELVCD